jgi:PAS domain S-box-containing protein
LTVARNLLFDIAHAIGVADAKDFHVRMQVTDPIEKLSAGPIHFAHSGWAFVDILPESRPSADEDYYLIYDHPYSFESDSWIRSGREVDFPVCVMNAGYSSGWCEESFGVPLVASEILCKAKGDEACRFIMGHPTRIEGYIRDYLDQRPELAPRVTRYEIPGFFQRKAAEEALERAYREMEVVVEERTADLQQASRALQESEEIYRTLVETSPDGITMYDLEGRLIKVNRQAAAMMGYASPEELEGLSVFEQLAPEERERAAVDLRRTVARGGTHDVEYTLRRRDGSTLQVELRSSVVRGRDGAPRAVISVVRDISGRKQAEAQIAVFRRFAETSGQGFGMATLEGVITYVNPTLCAMLEEPSPEQVIGKNLIWYYPEGLRGRVRREVIPTVMAKGQWVGELTIRSSGGTITPTIENFFLIRDERGEPLYLADVITDITKQKAAEAQIRQSEAKLRALFERSPVGLVLSPLQAEPDGLWASVETNPALDAILGLEGGALDGPVDSTTFMDPAGYARYQAGLDELLAGGQDAFELEQRFRRVDGAPFEGHLTVALLRDALGNPTHTISALQDVTERKQAQSQLAQADRMASMGMLAAGVAHEINNPLAYVLINLESLTGDIPRLTNALARCQLALAEQVGQERAQKALGRAGAQHGMAELVDLEERVKEAYEGARRISEIVHDLKTFTRMEDEQRQAVSINQVLDSVINMASSEIKYRARLRRESGRVPAVIGSPGRLSQVLLNVLVNAAQAIDEGDVERNEIFVRTWTEGAEVLVEVRDTGCGIPAEHLEQLFDPFFTTKPAGIGSGLGLSICHNIVAAHGGKIEVESEEGAGTRVLVRLPGSPGAVIAAEELADEEEVVVEAPTPVELRPEIIRGRILSIDDEPYMGASLRRTLGAHHEVVVADSGLAGQRILEQDDAFDLILCDLLMPDLSGPDLFQWITEHRPHLAPRVVFMTGQAFTPRARELLQRTSNVFIEKPFDPKNLTVLVQKLLAGQREPAPEG